MMKVYLLTEEQRKQLLGQKFDENSYFNPVLDNNDNWIITEIEVDETINQDLLWVKNLPLIDFEPKILPDLV
jgi:hypothetical protein